MCCNSKNVSNVSKSIVVTLLNKQEYTFADKQAWKGTRWQDSLHPGSREACWATSSSSSIKSK